MTMMCPFCNESMIEGKCSSCPFASSYVFTEPDTKRLKAVFQAYTKGHLLIAKIKLKPLLKAYPQNELLLYMKLLLNYGVVFSRGEIQTMLFPEFKPLEKTPEYVLLFDHLPEQMNQLSKYQQQLRPLTVRKTKKFWRIALVSIFAFATACAFLINLVIIPSVTYQNASLLLNSGHYQEAYRLFRETFFQDSDKQAEQISSEHPTVLEIGDVIELGTYPDTEEALEWLIISKEDHYALLLSKEAIEVHTFSEDATVTSWKDSTLRSYLNDVFISTYFDEDEEEVFQKKTIKTSPYSQVKEGKQEGDETEDIFFLLDVDSVLNLLTSKTRKASVSNYAEEQGAEGTFITGKCSWWLRTPTEDGSSLLYVGADGKINEEGCSPKRMDIFVRPAVWIDLELLGSQEK